jgi:hypothetical protein
VKRWGMLMVRRRGSRVVVTGISAAPRAGLNARFSRAS